MDKKNNVLKFPEQRSHRVRRLQSAETRRVILGFSLASIVFVAIFLNEVLVKYNRGESVVAINYVHDDSRAVASAHPERVIMSYDDYMSQQKLIEHLQTLQAPAQYGRMPSSVDRMTVGDLEGKYRFVRDAHGMLTDIQFNDSTGSGDRPKYVDPSKFLQDNQASFGIVFNRAEKNQKQEKKNLETYNLVGANDAVVGLAQIQYDQYGRLQSLHVEKK